MRFLLFLALLLATPGYANSEIQLLANPDGKFGVSRWTGGTTAPTVETTERGLGKSSIAWDAAGADTLTSTAASLSDYEIVKNRLCVMSAYYKGGDSNLKMQVWDGSTVLKELDLEAKTNWGRTGEISFICPDSGTLALRFEATADAAEIFLDQMFLGTRIPYVGPAVTEWVDCSDLGATFTPNWSAGTQLTKCRRVGDSLEVSAYYSASTDWASTGNFTVSLSGLSSDTSKINASSRNAIGSASAFDTSLSDYYGATVNINNSNGLTFSGDDQSTIWTGTLGVPFSWANAADALSFIAKIPILSWSGTSMVFQPTAENVALGRWVDASGLIDTGTFSNDTGLGISSTDARYRKVGDSLEFKGEVQFTGTGSSASNLILNDAFCNCTFNVPFNQRSGHGVIIQNNAARNAVAISSTTSAGGGVFVEGLSAGSSSMDGDEFGDVTSTDVYEVYYDFTVEVSEWADLGSVPAVGVEAADGDTAGLMTGDAQTFNGEKTFTDILTANDQIHASDGAVGAPGFSFKDDTNTGMFRNGTDSLRFSAGGTEVVRIAPTAVTVEQDARFQSGTESSPGITFEADTNMGFWVDGVNLRMSDATGTTTFSIGSSNVFQGDPSTPSVDKGYLFSGDTDTGLRRTAANAIEIIAGGIAKLDADTGNIRLGLDGSTFATDLCANGTTGLQSVDNCSSSIRYKTDVVDLPDEDSSKLWQLRPVKYTWKDGGDRNYGFIAEEVYEVLPNATYYGKNGKRDGSSEVVKNDDGTPQIEGVHYKHLTALLLSEMKKLKTRIEQLEAGSN